MGILRGLSSRLLTCGCLAGVYETYEGDVVTIVDARGPACKNPWHVDGKTLPTDGADAARDQISASDGADAARDQISTPDRRS